MTRDAIMKWNICNILINIEKEIPFWHSGVISSSVSLFLNSRYSSVYITKARFRRIWYYSIYRHNFPFAASFLSIWCACARFVSSKCLKGSCHRLRRRRCSSVICLKIKVRIERKSLVSDWIRSPSPLAPPSCSNGLEQLKEQCHEDFAVLGQLCAKIVTLRL